MVPLRCANFQLLLSVQLWFSRKVVISALNLNVLSVYLKTKVYESVLSPFSHVSPEIHNQKVNEALFMIFFLSQDSTKHLVFFLLLKYIN